MKITVLATMLVLGMSSAALATPDTASTYEAPALRDRGDRDDRDDRGDRGDRGEWRTHRPQPASWMSLGSLSLTRFDSRDQIFLHSRMPLSKLKLETSYGRAMIDKVVITFASGRRQVVHVDRALSRRVPMFIDLDGNQRRVTKIAIYGKGRRASISVLGA